ncbi:unnamed protein product, partial [Chrysoparadoxa australica]
MATKYSFSTGFVPTGNNIREGFDASTTLEQLYPSDRFTINAFADDNYDPKQNDSMRCERFSPAVLMDFAATRGKGERKGIKAAILSTYTLSMKALRETMPQLFGDGNKNIPVLVLHGDFAKIGRVNENCQPGQWVLRRTTQERN